MLTSGKNRSSITSKYLRKILAGLITYRVGAELITPRSSHQSKHQEIWTVTDFFTAAGFLPFLGLGACTVTVATQRVGAVSVVSVANHQLNTLFSNDDLG